MTLYVIIGLVLTTLAGGGLSAYYRRRALGAERALATIRDVQAEWTASYRALELRWNKAMEALRTRHDLEQKQDEKTAADAATDAGRAAELLRSLGGAGSNAPADVQPGAPDAVPGRSR